MMIAVIISSSIIIKSDCCSQKLRLTLMLRDWSGNDFNEGWKRLRLMGERELNVDVCVCEFKWTE